MEISKVVVREVVLSSVLVVPGVLTVVDFVVTSVVVNSENTKCIAHSCQSNPLGLSSISGMQTTAADSAHLACILVRTVLAMGHPIFCLFSEA